MGSVVNWFLAYFDNVIDEWLEWCFKIYGELENYPDDRKIERATNDKDGLAS